MKIDTTIYDFIISRIARRKVFQRYLLGRCISGKGCICSQKCIIVIACIINVYSFQHTKLPSRRIIKKKKKIPSRRIPDPPTKFLYNFLFVFFDVRIKQPIPYCIMFSQQISISLTTGANQYYYSRSLLHGEKFIPFPLQLVAQAEELNLLFNV